MARPEITGRKSNSKKDRAKKQVRNRGPPTHAFSIQEFCDAHRISRSRYFELKKLGLTPVEMKVGHRCLISFEAAARWRAEREAVTRQPERSGGGAPVSAA